MRAILPAIATLAILCAACSDSTTASSTDGTDREALASKVAGVAYPLVAITPAVTALRPSDSIKLQTNLTDANGTWKGKFVTWKSSDPTVLTVTVTNIGDNNGNIAHVKALKAGTATISATTLSKTSSQQAVTVSTSAAPADTVVAKVTVTPNPMAVATGRSVQLSAKALNAAGTTLTNAKLTFRSTNTAFLTVSSTGMVTGVAKGTANVEAHAANGKMGWSTVTDTATASTGGSGPVVGPGTGVGVNAVSADQFVGSIGIGAHFSYWDLLPYGNNVSQTIASVKAAGFRFVRDGLNVDTNVGWNDRYYGVLKQLTQAGIKLILVTQPAYLGNNQFVKAPYTNQSNLDTAVNRLGVNSILAFEGPNEVDNNNYNWGGIPAFGANAKAYQAAMYQHAKQIAPSVSVIGLTTTSSYGSSFIGDISSYMDAGSLHPYPSGQIPTADLSSMENALSVLNGAHKGWWVTEAGYFTAPNATQNLYQPGVSEAAQAKYAPRLYLDFFKAGISHTAIYELIDERVNTNDAEQNFGILHNDGSPKPAYNSIKNLIALLSDPGPTFTPTASLGYSLAGTTSTIRQALFQKRDGRFYLVLWNDVPVFNTSAKTDIANAVVPVAVQLTVLPRSVTRYQPASSSAGTSVPVSKTIAVSVPDSPVILEITP